MEWTGKVAVITGAGTGIGEATKKLLRSKGDYNPDCSGSKKKREKKEAGAIRKIVE